MRAYKDPTEDIAIANVVREEKRRSKMKENKCCGTCRYHWKHRGDDHHKGDYWCANEDCDCYGTYTGYRDGEDCEDWEGRE